MKRSTYVLAALTITLATATLLFLGLTAKAPAQNSASTTQPTTSTAPATLASTAPLPRPNLATAFTRPTSVTAASPPFWVAKPPQAPFPTEPGVHDPVMIKDGDYYYVFYTGGLINAWRSKDLLHWDRNNRTLPAAPGWIAQAVPGNRSDLWAPDISFHKGKFFLYYAASTFGTNTSAIGLATSPTLDPAAPNYKWDDAGLVMASKASDFYNCIDPNVLWDTDGTAWLTFGSFYWNQGGGRGAPANPDAALKGGIQIVKLDPATGKLLPDAKPQTIASRPYPTRAIEAPFLIREGKYYYLFVSWDTCCQGLRSTYRIMVGRAEKVTGPYVDREGAEMVKGGGTQLLAGDGKRIIGPGHEGLMKDGDRWLLVHHFYDGNTTNGTSRLQIRPLTFDDKAWPVLGKPLNSPN